MEKYVNSLRFADDVIIIANNEINTDGEIYGLETNYNKSTFMASRTQT